MNTKASISAVGSSFLIITLGFGAELASTARADESDSGRWGDGGFVCTQETLRGTYGFIVTGVRPTMPGGPQVSIVGTAITTFHGNGTFDQFDNINVNVNPPEVSFQPDRPGSGTYDLKPDCSGTMSLTAGGVTLELRITVVDHGREVLMAVVTPHVIVTSDGKKI